MSVPKSLSVTYYDPETEPVIETTSDPEFVPKPGEPTVNLLEGEQKPAPKKKRGRPKGSTNKKKKKKLPWFTIWRCAFWGAVSAVFVASMYLGVQGWLGQSAAHITLAVSLLATAFMLDRDWKKMRQKK